MAQGDPAALRRAEGGRARQEHRGRAQAGRHRRPPGDGACDRRRRILDLAEQLRESHVEREARRRPDRSLGARSGHPDVRPSRRERESAASKRPPPRRQLHAQPGMPAVPRQVRTAADAQGRGVEPARHRRSADAEEADHGADDPRRRAQMATPVRPAVSGAVSWVQDNGERYTRWLTLPNVLLIACVVVAVWFVFVPLSALLYNAFTEDTGFGPGAFSLDNFVEAYSSWHILRLFRNSLVFAVATAVTTFVMGALVAWVVERTDAPGASLFHTLSLMSFAVPGLLMAMAWIFVFSPNIGWGNAVLMSAFGLGAPPVNIYSMA